MPEDFIARLGRGPLLCDGAMGTLLYAKGFATSSCYDELNLTQPELIRDIHREYVQAGAEIIETNTFGANPVRLARHGLESRLREINRVAVQLAREAAAEAEVYVAGSVGPLGIRIEPLGKTSYAEARDAFRAQIAVLVEAGVDLLVLETFGNVEELHQALLAAREVNARVPVIAQVTVDEDGNCLDGSSPEAVAEKLTAWGADVIGCNCSVGPLAILSAIERMAAVTTKPLSAQPNAGTPRNVEGRNIYLCSPEYMANCARNFLTAGARIVGGCCGTTPEQIRAMKSEMRIGSARATTFAASTPAEQVAAVETVPLAQRSRFAGRLAKGEFVTLVEIVPPRGIDTRREIEGARFLKTVGVDAINVPDSPRASARMGPQVLCRLIEQQVEIETVLHYTCRDRNVPNMQADLLGAFALGVRNILCVTGDPPRLGNYPDATAVFDVDAIGLVNIVHNLNAGLDIGGNAIGTATAFVIGVGANPGAPNIEEELRRFEYKVEAGAEFCITQPVFDLDLLEKFLQRIAHCRVPVIAGIWPLTSARNAEFMRDELRVSVPDAIIDRMVRASSAEAARAEGVQIAREMLAAIKDMVDGAQVSAPFGRFACAVDVLEVLGSAHKASV